LIAAASAVALSIGAAQAQDAVQYQVTPGALEQALTQLPAAALHRPRDDSLRQ